MGLRFCGDFEMFSSITTYNRIPAARNYHRIIDDGAQLSNVSIVVHDEETTPRRRNVVL